MVKVKIHTNSTSTKTESWLEVVQFASLGLATLENNISRFYEGDACVCAVQIVEGIQVCVCKWSLRILSSWGLCVSLIDDCMDLVA